MVSICLIKKDMGVDVNRREYQAYKKRNIFSRKKNMLNPEILLSRHSAESSGFVMTDNKTVKDFNLALKEWGDDVRSYLVMSISSMIENDKELSKSLKINYYNGKKKASGDKAIDSIGFSFRREGVYVHFGVGYGYSKNGDSVSKRSKSNDLNRHPKP